MARIGAVTGGITRQAAPQPRRLPATPPALYLVAIAVGLVAVLAPDPLPWWARVLAVGAVVGGAFSLGVRQGEARPDPEARQRAVREQHRADTFALLLADDGGARRAQRVRTPASPA